MSYIVTKTDGTTLTTIIDGTKDDTSSSLTLIGRNYSNYGEFVANDFIRLLENFSADSAPPYPLEGQIWWKKNDNLLQVYDGIDWKSISHVTASSFAYSTTLAGDVWWDTTDQQLHVYNGTTPYNISGWVLVGPSYSSRFGKSGAIWESIQDSSGGTHHILSMYVDGLITGIISTDAEFTPDIAIPGFITIKKGYNIRSYDVFNGTSTNSVLFDNLPTSKFFRNDIDNVTTGNLVVQNNTGITIGATRQLKVNMNGIDASVINSASNGDFNIYVNVDGTLTRALYVEGSTGTIEVAGDPTTSPGIATKNYVDTQFVNTTFYGVPTAPTMPAGTANTSIATTSFVAAANTVMRSYVDSIHPLKANIANPIFTGVPQSPTMPAGTANTSIATTDFVSSANTVMRSYVDSIHPLKANIASPTFTGTPRSVTATAGDNSSNIATTAFVYTANLAMTGYVSSLATNTFGNLALKANIDSPQFTGNAYSVTPPANDNDKKIATTEYVDRANTVQAGSVAAGLALKANIDSPALTGTPTAPTPTTGDNSTKISTTAFVKASIDAVAGSVTNLGTNTNANLSLKADIASPTLTGTPAAPTPSTSDNSTRIATTAYVKTVVAASIPAQVDISGKADIASPTLTGTPRAPTATQNTNDTTIATTAYVRTAVAVAQTPVDISGKANIASPSFTGIPVAPTAALGTNTDQLATTAFVKSAVLAAQAGPVDLSGKADIAGPTFTGVPKAPTAAIGANTTQIATTAFVQATVTTLSTDIIQSKLNQTSWLQVTGSAGNGIAVLKLDDNSVMLADKNGIRLQGLPTAPTMPANLTGNLSIATTQYVQTAAQKWAGSAKTISSAAPSGGVDGDIWFKYS